MRKAMIRGYQPPYTKWMQVDMEDSIMTASKEPVVNNTTTVTIDRQVGANGSKLDDSGNNIIATDDYTIEW